MQLIADQYFANNSFIFNILAVCGPTESRHLTKNREFSGAVWFLFRSEDRNKEHRKASKLKAES